MRAPVLTVAPLSLALILAACSADVVDIHAESTSAGAGGHGTQGAGGGSTTATTTGAGGSGAGSSCCSEPVHVAGQVKVITAESDAAQQVYGQANAGVVVTGPAFVTDLVGTSTAWIQDSGACTASPPATLVLNGTSGDNHGLRIFVPANSKLCVQQLTVTFGGFRPY